MCVDVCLVFKTGQSQCLLISGWQVHLPRNQLFVTRTSAKIALSDILCQVCDEKNLDPTKYELRHPGRGSVLHEVCVCPAGNLDEVLELGCSLADHKLQEVVLVAKSSRPLSASLSSTDIMVLHREEEKRRQQAKSGSSSSTSSRFFGVFKRNRSDVLPLYLEEVPLYAREALWFQQDGALPHFAITVRQHLDMHFPNRWIDRRAPTAWPPRSPDIAPPDFWLWGHIKSIMYATPLDRRDEVIMPETFAHSMGEGSVSSDSLGGRSESPTRSDESVSRSASPPAPGLPPTMEPPPPRPQRKRRPAPAPPATTNNKLAHQQETQTQNCSSNKDEGKGEKGMHMSHSRNSSDSSGYHEASVLSESPDSHSGPQTFDSSVVDSLPRRSKLTRATNMADHSHTLSQSLSSLVVSAHDTLPPSKPSVLSASTTALSSAGHVPRKKRTAPPPPKPLAAQSVPDVAEDKLKTASLDRHLRDKDSLVLDKSASLPTKTKLSKQEGSVSSFDSVSKASLRSASSTEEEELFEPEEDDPPRLQTPVPPPRAPSPSPQLAPVVESPAASRPDPVEAKPGKCRSASLGDALACGPTSGTYACKSSDRISSELLHNYVTPGVPSLEKLSTTCGDPKAEVIPKEAFILCENPEMNLSNRQQGFVTCKESSVKKGCVSNIWKQNDPEIFDADFSPAFKSNRSLECRMGFSGELESPQPAKYANPEEFRRELEHKESFIKQGKKGGSRETNAAVQTCKSQSQDSDLANADTSMERGTEHNGVHAHATKVNMLSPPPPEVQQINRRESIDSWNNFLKELDKIVENPVVAIPTPKPRARATTLERNNPNTPAPVPRPRKMSLDKQPDKTAEGACGEVACDLDRVVSSKAEHLHVAAEKLEDNGPGGVCSNILAKDRSVSITSDASPVENLVHRNSNFEEASEPVVMSKMKSDTEVIRQLLRSSLNKGSRRERTHDQVSNGSITSLRSMDDVPHFLSDAANIGRWGSVEALDVMDEDEEASRQSAWVLGADDSGACTYVVVVSPQAERCPFPTVVQTVSAQKFL
ncbi:hypothetical protein PR048_027350 [Dryococelus australis]|uniref:Uncharacterized protein n=1 Tax=Dryococelus australis TaxID=614101 RepID=A0ABQ9GGB6_9NEOP|nr:hypothetical protein PR048_027350 [Dryococelus australis]